MKQQQDREKKAIRKLRRYRHRSCVQYWLGKTRYLLKQLAMRKKAAVSFMGTSLRGGMETLRAVSQEIKRSKSKLDKAMRHCDRNVLGLFHTSGYKGYLYWRKMSRQNKMVLLLSNKKIGSNSLMSQISSIQTWRTWRISYIEEKKMIDKCSVMLGTLCLHRANLSFRMKSHNGRKHHHILMRMLGNKKGFYLSIWCNWLQKRRWFKRKMTNLTFRMKNRAIVAAWNAFHGGAVARKLEKDKVFFLLV